MKQLIISLAFPGRENYLEIQKGLIKSIEKHWDGDAWINPDIPYTPHSVMPYQFKYDLIESALGKGYTHLWWMDATMRLNKNPSTLLDESTSGIVAFHNIGHDTYKYLSDEATHNLMINEDVLKKIPQCWGGCTGWNFQNKNTELVFKGLKEQIKLGSFKHGVSNRAGFIAGRHDQSVLSVLLYLYQVSLLEYGVISASKDEKESTIILYGD